MTCMDDGSLRAHLDGELSGSEVAEMNQHLAACADCRVHFEKLCAETSRTGDLLKTMAPVADFSTISPTTAYALFRSQVRSSDQPDTLWIRRLFAASWRPAWGLAAAAVVVAILVGVSPVRTWAQRVLTMLRVQKISVVTIDPGALMSNGGPNSRPSKLIDQFFSDSVVVTMKPGEPDVASSVAQAAELAGYPIQTLGSLGAPQSIEVNGESAFQMTIDRDRVETLLEEVGRSDINIPESANGALIAVRVPKIVRSRYGDCSTTNCVYLIQAPSPTVSVPPDLNMAEIAEAALELAGMNSAEAHSFCQTVDWTSTLVIPIPSNSGSYQTVSVDGVEGTLITETRAQQSRYSLLWVKNGMIDSLTGQGSSSDALALAASLQ
jgi:Putative zinc-finger